MTPNLGLDDAQRAGVLDILGTLLADEYVLATRTRNYRWNVVGPQFSFLHDLFGRQQRELDQVVDQVAERCRALGGLAPGTLAEFVGRTRLREEPGWQPPAREMVAKLLADHEALARHLREGLASCRDRFQDAATAAFLAGLLDRHQRLAWMLRASLEEARG
jgi:starvation-inducible DNA-binding protein